MFRYAVIAATLSVAVAGFPLGKASAEPAAAPTTTTLFVVDVSGSMTGSPLEQAKWALHEASDAISAGAPVGLRSFGGSCGDGGVLRIPVGPHDAASFSAAVDDLVAGGGTPTPDALTAAAADLPKSGPRQIVLISDGQSSCGDPCPTAESIAQTHDIDFKIHTVGYNAGSGTSSELTCIANATGGGYYDVTDGAGLAEVLNSLNQSDPCPDYAFFGLRGSGQTAQQSNGYGREVGLVQAKLQELFANKGATAKFTAIDYDSLGMDSLVGDVFSPLIGWPLVKRKNYGQTTTYYADSMWGGSLKLYDAISEYEADCRDASEVPGKMIVVGYSQGAAAANWSARSMTSEQLSRTSWLLIGDPLRHSDDRYKWDTGSAKPSKGLLQLPQTRMNTTFTPLPPRIANRTVSLCDKQDIVCDTLRALLWNDVRDMAGVHRSYSAEDLAMAALLAYSIVN